ncbi:MAG: hypothetical protein CVU39_05465 [Chloroflexi bacterium HGW-Chloroflexi-10]|nr:MAG: hypothetical protein CVU39_05465 [Chloroflexi bacterium HGW-Chloroflexi-10]
MAKSGRNTGRILILFAVIIIIIVIGAAAYVWLRVLPNMQQNNIQGSQQPPPIQIEEMVDIVITTQFIPRGEVITEGVVATITFPKKELVEGTFVTELDQVIGKKAIYPLEPRMPITPSMLVDAVSGGSIAAFDIPVDKTALSFPIGREALISYAPQPGDHVMVIGCMYLVDIDPEFQSKLPNHTASVLKQLLTEESSVESLTVNILGGGTSSVLGRADLDPTLNEPIYIQPSEEQRPRLVCQNIIQDATILRVGEFPLDGVEEVEVVEPAQPVPQGEEAAPEVEVKPDIVTLVVSPQDAVLLSYIRRANVDITLALRNPNNTSEILTDAVTQQYLMDQKNIPLPAKLPFAVEPRLGDFASPITTVTP